MRGYKHYKNRTSLLYRLTSVEEDLGSKDLAVNQKTDQRCCCCCCCYYYYLDLILLR